jgi:hypothetical protein
MGRLICLSVYLAMVVGGLLTLIPQLLYSPVIAVKFALAAAPLR